MAETIIAINTNVTTNEHFDRYGQSFRGTDPQISYRSNFKLRWQLFRDSPDADMSGADPSSWTPENLAGCGALATCDNDFRHRIPGELLTGLSAGESVSSIDIKTSAESTEIPVSGIIALYSPTGEVTDIMFSSAAVVSGGYSCTLSAPFTPSVDYPVGCKANISQEPLFQSMYLPEESDPAVGLFIFNCYAYSKRLAAIADTSNSKSIAVQGIELLPFITDDAGVLKELPAYLVDTFALTINLAEVGTVIPEYTGDISELLAAFASLVVHGLELQVYNTERGWHDYTAEDLEDPEYARSLTAYRMRLAGSTGDYSLPVPLLHGANAPQVQIQYSANGADWVADPAGCKYIRFSVDDGATWSAAQKYMGDNAPQVIQQFSVDGSANSWHDTATSADYFIHFSVNGGSTWSNALRIKAYDMKIQFGETAASSFHDAFNAAADKYIRFSVDGGANWSTPSRFMGADGTNYKPDATGAYSDRSAYDAEKQGFSFLVVSGEENLNKIFFKTSDDSGAWSAGVDFTPPGVSVQYSADGSSWHTTATAEDSYIRFSVDGEATWSNAVKVQGTSAYAYVAYAADSAGNDFSLTPSDDLDYWNWIHTSTEIPAEELTAAKFAELGSGWTMCQGDDGISYEWLSGLTVPDTVLGKDGDWYLNTANGDIYTKNAGAWTMRLNIVGPAGAGVTLKGVWDVGITYSTNDGVTYLGNFYIASRPSTGATPASSTDDWTLYVAKGEQGEPGQALDANYIDISTVTDGYLVISAETIPVSVEINNAVYPVLGMVKDGDTFKIPAAPILAAANLAEYSGIWRVWRAGGKQGVDGEPGINGGNFPITLVDYLPENPDASTLYLIPMR